MGSSFQETEHSRNFLLVNTFYCSPLTRGGIGNQTRLAFTPFQTTQPVTSRPNKQLDQQLTSKFITWWETRVTAFTFFLSNGWNRFLFPHSNFRSAVKEVGGHQKLKSDFRLDRELRDLGGAVGVSDLVGEVHADLLQHVWRDLAEVDLRNKRRLLMKDSRQTNLLG